MFRTIGSRFSGTVVSLHKNIHLNLIVISFDKISIIFLEGNNPDHLIISDLMVRSLDKVRSDKITG